MDLATQLKTNVISYEYSDSKLFQKNTISRSSTMLRENASQVGIGFSDKNLKADIEAVFKFANSHLKIKDKFLLIGYSGGALPSYYAATNESLSVYIKGLVIISPLIIGAKPVFSEINCPVYLIHGQLDDLAPFTNSSKYSNRYKSLVQWYPKKGSHFNILTTYRTKFLIKIKLFINMLKTSMALSPKTKSSKNILMNFEENHIKKAMHTTKSIYSTNVKSDHGSYECSSFKYKKSPFSLQIDNCPFDKRLDSQDTQSVTGEATVHSVNNIPRLNREHCDISGSIYN